MNKFLALSLFFSSFLFNASAVNIDFVGSSDAVLSYTADKSTGLNNIYVAFDASQISEMVISGIAGEVKIERYSNLGGGYAEEVAFTYEGDRAIVANPKGDMGYIIADSSSTTYIWLVNYIDHLFSLSQVYASPDQDCGSTTIETQGSGAAIYYYTIDGRAVELSREINVTYNNLEWDEKAQGFIQNKFVKTLDHLSGTVLLTPPLYCNSTVQVSGDRFLEQWGRGITVESPLVYANGVDVKTTAEQTNVSNDEEKGGNIIKSDSQGIGGSAPVDMEFRAYTTDAVIHNEWQISADEMFDNIDYRFNEQNLDYTFTEEGTYYVRFVGSNSDGSCEAYGETYTISVGASELQIPNAFTPNDDGVNDIWKVAYRSLISFKCVIFDRYGNELYHFDDPSEGWDGKYKGKTVKPGVYFYVIEAVGADGKKYKKGGDINIIQSKIYKNQGGGMPE